MTLTSEDTAYPDTDNSVDLVDLSLHIENINYSSDVLNKEFDNLDIESESSLEDVAVWIKQLEESIDILRIIKNDLGVIAAKKMDEKYVSVDGIGTLEKTSGYGPRKNWDTENLIPVVYARARDERQYDEETGEYEPEGAAVLRVLLECARLDWRTGKKPTSGFIGEGLRRLGIDPDEYSHRDKNVPTVRFVK
jgi:hypothetical protein